MQSRIYFLLAILFLTTGIAKAQTTSWKGTTSTSWRTASNWTNGVPTSSTDVIIGDANFTGSYQPSLSFTSYAKSITIGGTKASTLTQSKSVNVSGNITITSNGTFNSGNTVSLTGNWSNSGTYSATGNKSLVTFSGTAQTIGGSNVTTFKKIKINPGSTVTLNSNVTVSGSSSSLTVGGTLNPSESPTYTITASSISVSANGILKVNASTFAGNYSGTVTLNAGSIVEYAATTTSQTVSSSYTYSTLKISGAGTIKSLSANLTSLVSSSSAYGNIYVMSGTFDLGAYTAARGTTTVGGTFSISNGATLKIGSTNTFPANYNTNTLSLTSTVEYTGTNQTVSSKTYGNLTLSNSSGAATKTMPGTAFTIAGDLTSNIGTGTSVSFTAASNITISGNINIGSSTTFNGSSYSHIIGGNWVNNGTFTGSTSTINMTGPGSILSGSGTNNFYNLTSTASNISASASALNIAGNLATTGSGVFTHNAGSTLTMSGTSKTISGTGITLANLTITGTITTSSSLTITDNISVSGSLTCSAGNVTMSGSSKTIGGVGTIGFYGLLLPGSITTAINFSVAYALDVSGSFSASAGTATFTGTTTLNGTANLYNVTMNCTSLLLSTNSVLGIANTFTITAGTLNVTSAIPNTVSFNGTGAQTIPSATYNQLTLTNGGTKSAGGAITTNGVFTINASTTFGASSYTHSFYNSLVNNGTFTASTSTVSFLGTLDASITGATTFNILTINKSSSVNGVTVNSDISASTVNMTTGWIKTRSNILTITTTRTGNGIILGNIKRTHAFTTGTAYAFEGPDNTITFSAASSVTSITVSVSLGTITDFPYGSSANRLYNISIPAGTYTATLRLHYEDDELNGNVESSMQLWHYNGTTWNASGKTSNNTTSNYVEQSGLTNITNRWSLTDNATVLQWNGSASSEWSNAANWTVVQGTPGSVPTANDIVQLGTASFTNNPSITSAVNIKSIFFGSTAATSLSIASGGSLTVNGNVSGTWSDNTIHTIAVGAQTFTVNGNLDLSDGISGHAINLTSSTGIITIGGSLTESGGANITFTGTTSLYISKDFNYSIGTFSAGSSTVYYNGVNAQIVAGVTYNHLTSTKASGIASINNATTISGNLTISGSEIDINATTNILGNLTVSSGSTLRGNTSTINISGNLNNSGTFIPGNGTITFNGTSNQSISLATFNNIVINKASGNTNFTGNISVYGDFSILSGNIDLVSYTANRTSLGGSFNIAASASLTVGSTNNFPSNYSLYTLASTSTVIYNGTAAQTINGITYGNLTLSNGGANAKTLAATTTVNGNINISSGATLDASVYTISLAGNWINSGTFTPSTGAVLLNGTNKTVTGNTTFNKVTIYGSYTVAGSDIIYNGTINIISGGSFDAGSGVSTVNGDLINSGSLISAGTTTFTGTTVQTIRLLNAINSTSAGIINFNGTVSPVLNSTSTPTYATLNINNTGGVNPSVNWLVYVACNIASGATFNGGNSTHTFYGSFTNNGTVTSTGTLYFNPTTAGTIAFGSNFSSTGTVILGGAGILTITGTPSSLNDVTIANTNSTGVSLTSGWTISDDLTINNNAILNAGSYSHTVGGDIVSDGRLNAGSSTFTMSGTGAELSGSPNTIFNNFTVTGSIFVTDDYSVAGNFTNNGTYDAANSDGSLIMTGSGASTIGGTTNPSTLGLILINKSGSGTATLARNISSIANLDIVSGTLDASTFTLTQDAAGGALVIENNGVLKIGGTNTLPTFTSYDLDTTSTVDYSGSTQSITSTITYGNLTISASGSKTPAGALTVLNNLSLSNGTFVGGSLTHSIAGDWIMSSGTFTNTGTTILLNGIDTQFVSSTGTLKNLTINKTVGVVSLSSDVSVDGTLTLTSANISTSSNKLIITTNGSVSRTSGHIIGNLQKNIATGTNVAKTFEVGDTSNYAPVNVSFASVSIAGNLIVSASYGDHSNIAASGINSAMNVNKFWTLTNSGITFTNYSSTFNFLSGNIDAGANTSNFIIANKNAGTWNYPTVGTKTSTSTQATGLTLFGDFVAGQNGIKTWTGATSNNWNDATNWSPSGIPVGSENITITTGTSINANTAATCNNITCNSAGMIISISSGNSLTINGACTLTNGKININGQTLTLNGSFNGNATNCIKGSTASNLVIGSSYANANGTNLYLDQTTTTFNNYLKNFTVNNSVTMANAINIAAGTSPGTVTVSAGTLTTNDNLTLKSDAYGNGSIGNSSGSITGKVTIERYIPARRAWRLIAAPIATSSTQTINQAWQEGATSSTDNPNPGYGAHITGGTIANGFDQSMTNSSNLKYYSGSLWTSISNTNTPIAQQEGYFYFIRGNRSYNIMGSTTSTPPSVTTLRVKGELNQGTQAGKTINATGFTLAHNPYASSVNFSSVIAGSTNVKNSYRSWQPSLGGTYGLGAYVTVDWDGGSYICVPDIGLNGVIQSGEAFFTSSNNGTTQGSLVFREVNKTASTSTSTFGRPAGNTTVRMIVNLKISNGDNTTSLVDGVMASYNDAYSDDINSDDVLKFFNVNENISIASEDKFLSIERRSGPTVMDTLHLSMKTLKNTDYQLDIFPKDFNKQNNLEPVLFDKYTGVSTPLNIIDTTHYTFNVNADALSKQADRFSISYRPNAVLAIKFEKINAVVKDKHSIAVNWTVSDEKSIVYYEVERKNEQNNFVSIGRITPGTLTAYQFIDAQPFNGENQYRIKSIETTGAIKYSSIITARFIDQSTGISVWPNPVVERNFSVNVAGITKGNYTYTLINKAGQEIANGKIDRSDNNTVVKISLPTSVAAGVYSFSVNGSENNYKTEIIIK